MRRLLSHKTRPALVAVAAVAALVILASFAQACPNCKDAMVNDASAQGDVTRGYFYSILFMMSMPFALVGTFSFCMYRAVRKARQAEAQRNDVRDEQ